MTYRQEHSWIEDGYGEVRIVFTVSDTYEGTFSADSQSVNVFLLDSVSKKMPDSGGGVTESDLKLTVDEQLANDTLGQAAVNFVKDARNPQIFRYCTVFINPGKTLSVDDMLFSGVVEPNMEAEDLLWYGEHFIHTDQPLRRWNVNVKAFANVLLNDFVKLETIITGDPVNNIPGLNSAWIESNVGSRLSYYSANNFETKLDRMVVLEAVLQKLMSNFSAAMVQGGYSQFTFTTSGCKLPFRIHPARWNYGTSVLGDDNSFSVFYPPPLAAIFVSPIRNYRNSNHIELGCYHIYLDDYFEAKIDPNNELPSDLRNIEIHFDSITETWVNYDSLSELLISIARNYGLIVSLNMTSATNMHIEFRPIQTTNTVKAYLRSAIDAKLKISSEKITEKDIPKTKCAKYVGQEKHYPAYGIDHTYDPPTYQDLSNEKVIWLDRAKALSTVNAQGDYIPTTLAPVMAFSGGGAWLPTNIQIYRNGSVYNPKFNSIAGYYTGVVFRVDKYSSHKKFDKQNVAHDDPDWISWQPASYWTPGALISVAVKNRITGEYEEKVFDSFTDYIMMLDGRAEDFVQTEYSLTVNGFFAFSGSLSPITPDWKAIALGCEIDLFGLNNSVKEIKWSLKEAKVELKLVSATVYDFDTSTTPSADGGGGSSSNSSPLIQSFVDSFARGLESRLVDITDIAAGNVAVYLGDGTLAKATADATYYNADFVVISEQSGEKKINTAGTVVTNSAYSFASPGLPVFLRTAQTEGSFNISTEPLTARTATEDLYLVVGYTTGTNSWCFNPGFKMYFKPLENA